MTARDKIENLTTAWIGFIIVTGLSTFFVNGLGVLSLLATLGSVAVNVVLAVLIGRALVKRSRGTRVFCLVLNGIGVVFGTLGALKLGWTLLHGWSFALLYMTVLAVAHAAMNARSWRVLRDASVRSYFV